MNQDAQMIVSPVGQRGSELLRERLAAVEDEDLPVVAQHVVPVKRQHAVEEESLASGLHEPLAIAVPRGPGLLGRGATADLRGKRCFWRQPAAPISRGPTRKRSRIGARPRTRNSRPVRTRRFRRRSGLGSCSAFTVGLLNAVDRFEPERGLRFSTYASIWIRQSMLRARPTGQTRRNFRGQGDDR